MLKDAAVAKICEVEEDIVANWLHVVLMPDVFCCLLALRAEDILFDAPVAELSGASIEEEDVEDELELDDEVGDVEYSLFTLGCWLLLS